jgi:hypothetical protein
VTEQLLQQKTLGSNALEALQCQPILRKFALKRRQQLKTLTQHVEGVETQRLALLEARFACDLTLR